MNRKCAAKVLYHGTTHNAHEESLFKYNYYKNVVENDVYMSEKPLFPASLALAKAKRYNSKPLLLIIDKSKIPSDISPDIENEEWWHTESLPKDSYITYDLQKDPLKILKKSQIKHAHSKLEALLRQQQLKSV